MTTPQVSILIASLGRPSLPETLRSVRASAAAAGVAYEVVIADDSLEGAVTPLLEAAGELGEDLVLVRTASNNISTARNACLQAARADLVAFIDDDEWAEPEWLAHHLQSLYSAGADAAFGPVKAHYGAGLPAWIVKLDPFSRRIGPPGHRVSRGSTANALVRKPSLTSRDLAFDERLGRTGGEDSDLFGRLRHGGGLLIANDALVHEWVPVHRAQVRYLWRRALRHGQTYAENHLVGHGRLKSAGFFLATLAKLSASALGTLCTAPLGKAHYMRYALSTGRNLGKLRAQLRLPLVLYYDHFTPNPAPVEADPAIGPPPAAA